MKTSGNPVRKINNSQVTYTFVSTSFQFMTDAYQQLNKFVGKWKTRGRIPENGSTPEVFVEGTDTYEWLPGDYFLKHSVDVMMGEDRNQTLEIIGFDKE